MTAAAFLAPGFAKGERCLYVASEPGIELLFAELTARGIDVAAERERGALQVLSSRDVYLRVGNFSADAMLDYLDAEEREATRAQFSGLRYAGEMSWAVGAGSEDSLIHYEARLNEFLEGRRMVVSCFYNRERFDDAIIHDVLRTHPLVIVGDREYDNPYYEPAHLLLQAAPAPIEFRRTRARWWLERLRAVAASEAKREELMAQLRQAQKLDTLGRLASGVAHDFNNLLTVIVGCADLLRGRVDDSESLALVQDIRRAADQSTALTRQLLSFSRKEVASPRAVELTSLIAEAMGMLRRLLGQGIRVKTELEGAPLVVRVDPAQIQQVVMNLAVNARDAMPDGGTLTLRTRAEQVDGERAARLRLNPGQYAVLQVGDTGTGMTDEVRERLFEPFFTTKGHGRGTGLGLAVVQGIVLQSDGAIDVESRPGEGSVFTLWLPSVVAALDSPQVQDPLPATAAAGETVLLVEDEEAIRRVLRAVLERAGYRVREAATAADGLREARAHAADLVILDIGLPDLRGDQLAESLLRLNPAARILLLSGYTEESIGERVRALGVAYLAKPFTLEEISTAVAAVLGRRA
ncbi:MAG: MEDS domain-containing protein [Gemmatimonadaceae bacterium]|nr:MEDS domain-containing protein [Gemmatimonadaceae bacterium]